MSEQKMMYRFLRVDRGSYAAPYDNPEDDYEEFVQHATVELCVDQFDVDGSDGSEDTSEVLATLYLFIIRFGRADEVNVLEQADAHSCEAEEVAGYLHNVDSDEFYDRFDVITKYANVLLIDDADLGGLSVCETRQFVKRTADQFDVDLVMIRKGDDDDLLARPFVGFFEEDGPFLIYSKAHLWPKAGPEPALEPELTITSTGGDA